ncbi:MAG: copper chaperone PCu(A)C [Actinobacteria bacterium]|nr:copper chaperone PCu(A)C [Actinomycetota bacterium]
MSVTPLPWYRHRRPRAARGILERCAATPLAGAASGSEIAVADARVPVPAGVNAAAYMTLTNDGDTADQLIGARTDIAGAVELHQTATEGGSTSMQQVDAVELPAGSLVVLEPGGLHVMLLGVTQELAEGDTVDLTLIFEGAGERTVSAEVVPLGDLPAMDMEVSLVSRRPTR